MFYHPSRFSPLSLDYLEISDGKNRKRKLILANQSFKAHHILVSSLKKYVSSLSLVRNSWTQQLKLTHKLG